MPREPEVFLENGFSWRTRRMIEELVMQKGQFNIADWQTTLEKTFGGVRGNTGTLVQSLYERERQNVQLTRNRCTGFTTLMQSFLDCAVETLVEASAHGAVLNAYNHAFNMAALRRMRASFIAFERAYYFDAASQLRSVFEVAMYVGAVLRGMCWFDEIHAFASSLDLCTAEQKEISHVKHAHATRLNQNVAHAMYGENSGLTADEQAEIRDFLRLQHMHVHHGESNAIFFILQMMQDQRAPTIAPDFDLRQASIYANTAACAAWCQHRILMYLSEPGMNSPTWRHHWGILDNAFRQYLGAWDSRLASAFIKMMDTSFTFDESAATRQLRKTQPGIRAE